MSKVLDYIKETQAEMKHVSWPTRKQAIVFTVVVITVSVVTGAYLGVLDALFTYLLKLAI